MLEERLFEFNSIIAKIPTDNSRILSALNLLIEPIESDELECKIPIDLIKKAFDSLKILEAFDNITLFSDIFQGAAKISVLLFIRVDQEKRLEIINWLISQSICKFEASLVQINNLHTDTETTSELSIKWLSLSTGLLETSISYNSALLLFDHELDYNQFWVKLFSKDQSLVHKLLHFLKILQTALKDSKNLLRTSDLIIKNSILAWLQQLELLFYNILTFFTTEKIIKAKNAQSDSYYLLAQNLIQILNFDQTNFSINNQLSKFLLSILNFSNIEDLQLKDIMYSAITVQLDAINTSVTSLLKFTTDQLDLSDPKAAFKKAKLHVLFLRFSIAQSTKLFKILNKYKLSWDLTFLQKVFASINNLIKVKKINVLPERISHEFFILLAAATDILFDAFVFNSLFLLCDEIIISILSQYKQNTYQNHHSQFLDSNKTSTIYKIDISNWIITLDYIDQLLILQSYCFHFNQLDYSSQICFLTKSTSLPSLVHCIAILADRSLEYTLSTLTAAQKLDGYLEIKDLKKISSLSKFGSNYHNLVLSICFPVLSLEIGSSLCTNNTEKVFKLWWAEIINIICTCAPAGISGQAAIDAYLILAKTLDPSLVLSHILWIINLMSSLYIPSLLYSKFLLKQLIHRSFAILPTNDQFDITIRVLDLYNKKANSTIGDSNKNINLKLQRIIYLTAIPWKMLFSSFFPDKKAIYTKILAALQSTFREFSTLFSNIKGIYSTDETDQKSLVINSSSTLDQKVTLEASLLLDALCCFFTANLPRAVFEKCTNLFNSWVISILSNAALAEYFVKTSLLNQIYNILSLLVKANTFDSFSKIIKLTSDTLTKSTDRNSWIFSSLIEYVAAYSISSNYQESDNNTLKQLFQKFFSTSKWHILQVTTEKILELIVHGFDAAEVSQWITPSLEKIVSGYIGDSKPVSPRTSNLKYNQILENVNNVTSKDRITSFKHIENNWNLIESNVNYAISPDKSLINGDLTKLSHQLNHILSHDYISINRSIPDDANKSIFTLYKTLFELYKN
ncbi:hypothetical protein BB561_002597 [Smittium simulii]|uniref:Uncharacterized protein n=1 Tax=Smittium simulii TaxID=133385 RepID=A0A2T9YPY9_9FUNG|nr:hypothetical protein BB561_002597 [Smittium simulii]